MKPWKSWTGVVLVVVALGGCGQDGHPPLPGPEVPLAPASPWPKFRGNARQTGHGFARPKCNVGPAWDVRTGKGIFSTPVVGADGTVYVGSADRVFYALHPDGSERWRFQTGEIIDSSALLDDLGRIYFGSGDGHLYALDAATGEPVWTFEADPPSVNDAFINWFEGNVAIGPDGTLYVPNDNFFVYAIDRENGEVVWKATTPDQTWSLPAVNPENGNLFFGNNNLLEILGANTYSLDASGKQRWIASSNGTIAASPLLTSEGKVILGGYDGFVRAYGARRGNLLWEFGARWSAPLSWRDNPVTSR